MLKKKKKTCDFFTFLMLVICLAIGILIFLYVVGVISKDENNRNEITSDIEEDIFVEVSKNKIGEAFSISVIYNTDTKVMYGISYKSYMCGISVLYNADGTERVYNEDTSVEFVCIGKTKISKEAGAYCTLYTIYDTDTLVMYSILTGYRTGSGLEPLYNPDGTLQLYTK